jgi:hypothetical protein
LIDGIQSTETTLQSLAKRNVNNTAETNAFAEKTNAAFAEFESLIE